MKRATKLMVLLSALALVAAACGDDGGGGGDKPEYKLYVIGALTGDFAQLFIHSAQGAELAVEQVNAKGDLPVRLTLVKGDSQGGKDAALPIANQIKDDATVLGVIGPGFSGESFAVNPILGQAGIPQVTPSATNPGLNALANVSGKTWWRGVANDNDQGGPTPRIIFNYLKGTKVFIGHDKSAYGQGLATIVRNGVNKDFAGKLSGFVGVDPGKKDYSALVSQVTRSDADVFYWGGYSPEGALIAEQLKDRGFTGKYLGADGSKDDTFLKAKAAVEGAHVTCPCSDPNVATDDASKKFVADYNAKYKTAPGVYGAEGYDSVNVFAAAIKSSGDPGTDITAYRAKIASAIAASNAPGLTKTYTFQQNGELAADQVKVYLYVVEGGAFKLLGEAATLAG